MKFHGSNTLELNMATVRELLAAHLSLNFKADGLRITDVTAKNYGGGLEVKFTTDPDPNAAPVLEPSPPFPMAPTPRHPIGEDDDHPF